MEKEEYEKITKLIEGGKFSEAKPLLEEGLKESPESIFLLLDLGYIQGSLGESDEAIKSYNKVIDIAPTSPSGWMGLGFVNKKLMNYPEAARSFRKVVEMDPSNASAHFELGEAYFSVDDYATAQKAYYKAIQFGGAETEGETLHRIAQTELGQDNIDKAIEISHNLLKKHPHFISGYNLLGTAFYLKEDWKQSADMFKKYLAEQPDDEAAKNLLAKAEEKL